ncbi:MAG: carbohydrate binding domain-containing protein [Pseudomonadota bacterium]
MVLIVCGIAGFYILSAWRGFYPYRPNLSMEGFLRAIELDPSNPDPFYRLGVFHQWEIHNIDLKKSLRYLGEAIKRNPLEQEYWLSLAKVLQRMGEAEASEKALEKAVMVFPTGYQGRWTAGNLLLLQEKYEKALPHFSYILTQYPNQSSLVFDVWGKVVQDPDYLLENLVPQDSFALTRYLSYLYDAGDREMVKKVWNKRASVGHKADRAETIRHVDFLISRGDLSAAYRIYMARLREEKLPAQSAKNIIINGGFEEEKLLGGGFDWKMGTVPGAVISFDRAESFAGKSSLKISFNGKENVNFHHVYQYVALKPNQEYLLKAHVKTKAVSTKSGIKLEIIGIGPAFHGSSEPLTGDNGWKELTISFRTPDQSPGGIVRLRRARTDKFDRFISGTVWVDNVQLTEKSKSH